MNKHLTLMILTLAFGNTANTSMAQNLWDVEDKKGQPNSYVLDKDKKEGISGEFAKAWKEQQKKIKAQEAKKKAAERKERKELFYKVLAEGKIISQGYQNLRHGFVVIYKRKIYNCFSFESTGECLEHTGPLY